jgi:hypothetical protein
MTGIFNKHLSLVDIWHIMRIIPCTNIHNLPASCHMSAYETLAKGITNVCFLTQLRTVTFPIICLYFTSTHVTCACTVSIILYLVHEFPSTQAARMQLQ